MVDKEITQDETCSSQNGLLTSKIVGDILWQVPPAAFVIPIRKNNLTLDRYKGLELDPVCLRHGSPIVKFL